MNKMKVRQGFVSNSSSSSFICEICGNTKSGYDLSLSDMGFVMCENEHIFCDEHLINMEGEIETLGYENLVLEKHCPICQFEEYSQPELARYLVKEYSIPKEIVFSEIKAVNKRRKKLYDNEYIEYVFKKHNLSDDVVLKNLKDRFEKYSNFLEYIRTVG